MSVFDTFSVSLKHNNDTSNRYRKEILQLSLLSEALGVIMFKIADVVETLLSLSPCPVMLFRQAEHH